MPSCVSILLLGIHTRNRRMPARLPSLHSIPSIAAHGPNSNILSPDNSPSFIGPPICDPDGYTIGCPDCCAKRKPHKRTNIIYHVCPCWSQLPYVRCGERTMCSCCHNVTVLSVLAKHNDVPTRLC
jgi:hypothetical protein